MKISLAVVFAALASACAASAPDPQAPAAPVRGPAGAPMIRLYESPCYFPTCISYAIEVAPNGNYTLTRFTPGQPDTASSGALGPDVWAKAEAAFAEADFAAMPERMAVDNMSQLGGVYCSNDLPAAEFTRSGVDGAQKKVHFNTGCGVAAPRKLLADLRELFRYRELVRPN